MERITPAVGLHALVPNDEYHLWNAANNSRLTLLQRSPAHLKAYLDGHGDKDTPAKIIGRAIHTAILEPDSFATRYTVADPCTAQIKSGARLGDPCGNPGRTLTTEGWRCGQHEKGLATVESGAEVIADGDYRRCLAMRDAVYAHPAAYALLAGIASDTAETSIAWIDPETGVLCKSRPDYFTRALAGGAVLDLKSTEDASRDAFQRSIWGYGYHRQGAHCLDGMNEIGIAAEHFAHIAVEKEYPHNVAVYRLRDDVMVWARQELAPLKRRYAECLESDVWPGYSPQVEDIALPAWAYAQIEEATRGA